MVNGTKKGLSPLAWIGIGCGLLVLVGVVVVIAGAGFAFFKAKEVVEAFEENPQKTAAELLVRANPDLELVSTDDSAGTITIRDTSKGEEVTLNFEDIAEGNFSITTDEGEYSLNADSSSDESSGGLTISGPDGETRIGAGTMEDVPDWVPLYPGSDDIQSSFSSSNQGQLAGILSGTTNDSTDDVVAHYKKELEADGYEVNVQTYSLNDQQKQSVITAKKDGGKTAVNLTVGSDTEGVTNIAIQYNGSN